MQTKKKMNKNESDRMRTIRMFMLKSDTELNLHVSINHLIVCMAVYCVFVIDGLSGQDNNSVQM